MEQPLFSPEALIEPHPIYKHLRDEEPVKFVAEMNFHLVSRYDLIREVVTDVETYSSQYSEWLRGVQAAGYANASAQARGELDAIGAQLIDQPPTMLTLDPPAHTNYRNLVAELFTAGRVRETEPQVIETIENVIAAIGERTAIDFVADFAFPVPLEIIGKRLGIPGEDVAQFNECATSAAATLRMTPLSDEQMVRRAQLALDLQRMLVRLIDERRAKPDDDMISVLATSELEGEGRRLEYGEILSILGQFLVAGHETTTSAFAWGMLILCRNPDVQAELRAEPKRIKTFVEEVLRLEAPVQGLPRLVTKNTELGGYPLKAGEIIFLRYGSANRDERKFEEPDKCLVHRKGGGAHMAFGQGTHFCIGAPLSRQELNRGFEALLARYENFRLSEDHPAPTAEPSVILRNLPELHVVFDPA